MLETLDDAKAALEAEGLYVSRSPIQSLWIAGNVRDVGDGIRMSNDACALIETTAGSLVESATGWIAIFPWNGLRSHEIQGSLTDLVSLILAVYAEHRLTGGDFGEAATRVLSEQGHLTGRALTQA